MPWTLGMAAPNIMLPKQAHLSTNTAFFPLGMSPTFTLFYDVFLIEMKLQEYISYMSLCSQWRNCRTCVASFMIGPIAV